MQIAGVTFNGAVFSQGEQARLIERAALIVFACVSAAATGVFFTVSAGIILSSPSPLNALYSLEVGTLAFAVLVLGQLVHWSRLALCAIRGWGS